MTDLNISLPDSFFLQEERCGYVVKPEMKKVWAVLLDLLNEFRKVCSNHNIKWFADAGTILGAARHGGFIPWDDDIDVMLLREDYDHFISIASSEFHHPYFIQTESTDPTSARGHCQLRHSETTGILSSEMKKSASFNQGIFLDIFPIDTVPDDEGERNNFIFELSKLHKDYTLKLSVVERYRITYRNNLYLSFRDYMSHMYHKFILHDNYKTSYYLFENEIARYKGQNSEYVAKLVLWPFKARRLWKREWFDTVEYLPFEDLLLPVPGGYLDLLNTFYGDWKQYVIGNSTHGSVFFDVDNPYTKYIHTRRKHNND